jgi:hypothetical protein
MSRTLKDGDVITLLPMSPAFGNAVTLQGTVAQPLRHKWVRDDLCASSEVVILLLTDAISTSTSLQARLYG